MANDSWASGVCGNLGVSEVENGLRRLSLRPSRN
jgi:hypothetical protein